MKNYKYNGQSFVYSNSTGSTIPSGGVVVQGEYVGIASVDIPDGESGVCQRTGVVEVQKQAGLAVAQGDKAYWDGSEADNLPADDGTNTEIGIFHQAADAADSVALVLLKGGAAAFN